MYLETILSNTKHCTPLQWVSQRGCVVSILKDVNTQKLSWAAGSLTWAVGLDQMTSRDPFQSQSFCHCATITLRSNVCSLLEPLFSSGTQAEWVQSNHKSKLQIYTKIHANSVFTSWKATCQAEVLHWLYCDNHPVLNR